MKKWVKMITDEGTTNLMDIEGLMYLDFKEEDVETVSNELSIQGTDGVLLGNSTFAPFNLVLRFVYSGVDVTDYHLLKAKLRGMLYRRTPFYIIHSDMPGKKYAVITESTAIEDVYGRNGTFEITFTVYKGYSESLYDTDQFSLMSDNWQFESGLLPDLTTSYSHKRAKFEILNGSNDTINPRMRHRLKIIIRINAPNGFELVNRTTGDIFKYTKEITTSTPLTIEGGYPFLHVNMSKIRCGRSTNHGIITLAPSINKFEIWGNVTGADVQFIFPFIYR